MDDICVYKVPKRLLDTLQLKGTAADAANLVSSSVAATATNGHAPANGHTSAVTRQPQSCAMCSIDSFASSEDQRLHNKSDHHRFNARRSARRESPVPAAQFERMMDEISESLSGSEVSDDISSDDDKVTRLVDRMAVQDRDTDEVETSYRGRGPIAWFSSSLNTTTFYGVYRVLLQQQAKAAEINSSALSDVQLSPDRKRHIVMFMTGGGHFAATVTSLALKQHKEGEDITGRHVDILASKTFHRYITRRKQGGAQSAYDQANGAASSAGSSLRRYNEAALNTEIQELIASWREYIHSADLIFIRATGKNSRNVLFEGPFKSSDPRIRSFPFMTRRPTKSELVRCFVELAKVKISQIDFEAIARANAAQQVKLQAAAVVQEAKKAAAQAAASQQLQDEEIEMRAMHTSALVSLVKRGKTTQLLDYLHRNKIDPNASLEKYDTTSPTPSLLHLASSLNSKPDMIEGLVLTAHADPTLLNSNGQTAFDLVAQYPSPTRDIFRVLSHEHPTTINWSAAHVLDAIPRSELDRQAAEADRLLTAQRELNIAQLVQKATEPTATATSTSKGLSSLGHVNTDAGLSPAMRIKIERERRARAAELRRA